MNVGKMHFDDGTVERSQRVMDGDGGMRVGRGVDDDARGAFTDGLLYGVHQPAFRIALPAFHLQPQLRTARHAGPLQVLQGLPAVGGWLPLAQQVQVGAVDDVDGGGHPQVHRGDVIGRG